MRRPDAAPVVGGLLAALAGWLAWRYARDSGPAQALGALVSQTEPGHSTNSADALNPGFRTRLDAMFRQLRSEGFSPTIRESWRDQERQNYYLSKGWSTVSYSYHMVTDSHGNPDALAADVYDAKALTDDGAAQFYFRLRKLAPSFGFESGGAYKPTSARWAKYSDDLGPLGWDPVHLEPANFSIASAKAGKRPWA